MAAVKATAIGGPRAGETIEIDEKATCIEVPDFPDLPYPANARRTPDLLRYRYRRVEHDRIVYLVPDEDEELLAEYETGIGEAVAGAALAKEVVLRGLR